jgi:hypothetical protein
MAEVIFEDFSNRKSITFDQFETWYGSKGMHDAVPWLELIGWSDGAAAGDRNDLVLEAYSEDGSDDDN